MERLAIDVSHRWLTRRIAEVGLAFLAAEGRAWRTVPTSDGRFNKPLPDISLLDATI